MYTIWQESGVGIGIEVSASIIRNRNIGAALAL
jgi:hypothetical protein